MVWTWRNWKSILLVTCGSLLAGTLIAWELRRLRSRHRPSSTPTPLRRPADTRLKPYCISHCRIDIADSKRSCKEILGSKSTRSRRILGLDCEWRGRDRGGRCPVALLQMAFLDDHCVLVQLCKMKKMPHILTEILEDERVLKFGVSIHTDVQRLFSGFGVKVVGCVDIQHIAKRCGLGFDGRSLGLQKLTEELLGVRLDKSWRLRCSDWERKKLSPRQVNYAASDAVVALDILRALIRTQIRKQKSQHQTTPPSLSDHSPVTDSPEGTVPDDECLLSPDQLPILLSLCRGVVDVSYQQPKRASLPVRECQLLVAC